MNAHDRMLLERAQKTVSFTYCPALTTGRVKLVRSSLSEGQKKHLHRLAIEGYLAESWHGCGGHGEPPETTVTFSLTAKGRDFLGIHAAPKPRVHGPCEEEDVEADSY